jgi:phage tail-like protein
VALERAYVASKFVFELDGDGVMGFLNSAEGGGLKTDVVDYKQGAFQDVWRQIGRPKFEDITIKVGMAMSQSFYGWVTEFFNRKLTRKNGAIILADFNYKERARRSFMDALISEVQIPTLDASSKEAMFITIKLAPEAMTYETIAAGKKIANAERKVGNKSWHSANFAFSIDGYGDEFRRVTKVDGFSIKQQILEYPSGHRRTPIRVPGRLEYPNLTVYIPSVDADKVITQANKRLLTYEAPPPGGMNGIIELKDPHLNNMCTITLTGVDIVSAEPQKSDAQGDSMAMVKVMIQCEKMTFTYVT